MRAENRMHSEVHCNSAGVTAQRSQCTIRIGRKLVSEDVTLPRAAYALAAHGFPSEGNLGPVRVRFIGKAAMARNKLAAGRPKDLVDAELLQSDD